MKKSTHFDSDEFGILHDSSGKSLKKLPTKPRKETLDNIMAFTKAYSVRKSRNMDKIELILN